MWSKDIGNDIRVCPVEGGRAMQARLFLDLQEKT
jgi:hypothetical protein